MISPAEGGGTPRAPHTPADYQRMAAEGDVATLRSLVSSPYSFVAQELAGNPHAPVDVLRALAGREGDGDWNEHRLLSLLARHPGADRTVLLAVLDRVAALLGTPGRRPYAAALALAGRAELSDGEIGRLGRLPGASRRLRRGLRQRREAQGLAR